MAVDEEKTEDEYSQPNDSATDDTYNEKNKAPSTISTRRSLLGASAAAACRSDNVSGVPASVVTTGTASKPKKARTKSPAINKMTADNNLIACMMEIKNSVKEVDTKWSSKTQEMEYKMKCVENVERLKGMGWTDSRIGELFPDFAPFIGTVLDKNDDNSN